MVLDSEETLRKIHEVNILMNSNMLDATKSAKESKDAIQEIILELEAMGKGTEKSLFLLKDRITSQAKELEIDLKSELFNLSEQSLNKMAGYQNDAVKQIVHHQGLVLQKIREQLEQLMQSFDTVSNEYCQLQKESTLRIVKIVESHSEVHQQSQKNLSNQLERLNATLNRTNEAMSTNNTLMIEKMDEHTRMLKKSQLKWFIWVLIVVFIGYFF